MNVLRSLNSLHGQKLYWLVSMVCSLGYLLKGYGWVSVNYCESFRAYAFRVGGKTYLSPGPGWAYSYPYLHRRLIESYCLHYLPRAGDCVVDLGAGLGEESVILAQLVGDLGKVYAIEANPVVFGGLKFCRDENGFAWLDVSNLAIYHSDGEVEIEDDEGNYLSNTIKRSASSRVVEAKTFDSFVRTNNIERIDFVKVNIEGAEQYLIMGMNQSIANVRNICVSCHDFRQSMNNEGEFYVTRQKVFDFLTRNDFETVVMQTGDVLLDNMVFARNRRFPVAK